MTSAPRSERIMPPRGPAWYRANSNTLMPSRDPATRSSSHVDCRRTPCRRANASALVGLSWVVSRIDIGDREWPDTIYLDNCFLRSPAIMVHPFRHVDVAAG